MDTSEVTRFAPVGPRGGRAPKLHDCGKDGWLTLDQIATKAGISYSAAKLRVDSGMAKNRLCRKTENLVRLRKNEARSPTMIIAMKLARHFVDHEGVPTVKSIQNVHPMSDSQALRWRAVMAQFLQKDGFA